METIRPPFPRVISNSVRNDFISCPRKFELNHLHHWKPKHTSQHLQGGGAFAKGMEVARKAFYVEGLTSDSAIEAGWVAVVDAFKDYVNETGDVKTVERMSSALVYYFTAFPLEHDFVTPYMASDGVPGIEFSGIVPIDVRHPETGDPILLGGRFDLLGQHRNGQLYVVDEKTTGQLGPSWVDSWKLDSQFTEYCFIARDYGRDVVGAIIRGISILKNGHNHAQSIQMRPEWQIARWYEQLLRDVNRMVALWHEGYFDYNIGPSCKAYGGCQYRIPCASPEPLRWLDADFVQREYNPYAQKELV